MYSIAEVSKRSGFNATTLRYYEDIGLLPLPSRTQSGYRSYEPDVLDRLAFITRAKQLGCSLVEIETLIDVWSGKECAPLQEQLNSLVTARIRDAEEKIADLVAFTAQLREARSTFSRHKPEGACDEQCGCTAAASSSVSRPVRLLTKAATEPPIACTLNSSDLADRLTQWRQILAHVTARSELEDGVRLSFSDDAAPGDIVQTAMAEQKCCSFFSFSLSIDVNGVALDVRAPIDAQDMVRAVFGES